MDSFATGYVHVSDALLQQLITICGKGGQDPDGRELSQAVAMVQAIAPRDETEAMLAVQMVAVHKASWRQPQGSVRYRPAPTCSSS